MGEKQVKTGKVKRQAVKFFKFQRKIITNLIQNRVAKKTKTLYNKYNGKSEGT